MSSVRRGTSRTISSQREVATPEFISVIAGAVIVMLGFGLVQPIISDFAKRFPGVGNVEVAYIVIGFAAFRLAGNVFVGRALAKLGERRTTVLGAIIVGASSLACAFAPSYLLLLISRVLGGVGSALYFGGLLSFMLATTPAEQRGRASSLFQGAVSAGLLVGPAIGGLLGGTVGMVVPFVAYGVMCFIGALWSHRTMRAQVDEHGPAADRSGGMATLRVLLRDRTYRVSLAVGFIGFAVTIGGITILMPPLWQDTLQQSGSTVGIPFSLSVAASLLVVFHAGTVVDRIGRRGPMVLSAFALAGGVAVLGLATHVWMALAAMFVIGVSSGYSRPAAVSIIGDVASEEQRPAAVGGFRVAQDLGALIGPAIVGVVSDAISLRAAFLTLAAMAGAVALWSIWMRETAPQLVGSVPDVEDPGLPPIIEPAG